jgi:hypothetical protein
MQNQFFILIDKHDSEKFRKFKLKQFNSETKKILEDNNSSFVWGIHKGKITKSIWNKIKKNDKIFLTIPENNFEIFAYVSKKIQNKKFGNKIYPDEMSSNNIQHFLFFNDLQITNISYHELIHNSTSKIVLPISGIHEIKETYYRSNDQTVCPKKFVQPKLTIGPPQKSKSEVYRFIRDSHVVKELKKLYNNKCQICGYTFEYKKNVFYSEVHHYHPLEELGDDDRSNMIVVCPNHHAEFDHKMIAIGLDGKNIIDKNGEKCGEIKFHKDHTLAKKNIQSQLRL